MSCHRNAGRYNGANQETQGIHAMHMYTISIVNYNGIVVLTDMELVYVDLGWLYMSSYLLRANPVQS